MKNYINYQISADIDKCVKTYGIEGTEDKLYTALAGATHLRDRYLEIFYKKFNFLNKN